MANESGSLLVKGLDPDDINVIASYAKEHGTSVTAIARDLLHERAEVVRREEALAGRRATVRRVHANPRGPRLSAEAIQAGLAADRAQAGIGP